MPAHASLIISVQGSYLLESQFRLFSWNKPQPHHELLALLQLIPVAAEHTLLRLLWTLSLSTSRTDQIINTAVSALLIPRWWS